MIVKFDHLSYSCSEKEEKRVIEGFCNTGSYRVQFYEKIKNVKVKMNILQYPSEFHGLAMLQPADKNEIVNIPVEITSYPEVKGDSPYNLKEGIIEFKTKNLRESRNFFQQLGFREVENGILSLKTILDKKIYNIRLVETNIDYSGYLDVNGFSSMACIVAKIEEYVKELKRREMTVTDLEQVFVNNRKLKVCFACGKYGEIVELIGVDR